MALYKNIIKKGGQFYGDLKKDPYGRYRSWEHCYTAFNVARLNRTNKIDNDILALHLAFYLASWGMYRGSSFLLQKDYKIHIKAVEIILRPKYNSLLGIKCKDYIEDPANLELLFELSNKLKEYYNQVRLTVKRSVKQDMSNVLITKILMGTLGCVCAYDRYFVSGIKALHISTANYNDKSVKKIAEFYLDNENDFNKLLEEINAKSGLKYPQMKLLDMCFWQFGFDLDNKNSNKIVR